MNRQEFEELELQVQQSELPLKSYLQQIGVSYSTYHYWRRKCSVYRSSIKHELAPISFKQAFTESSQEEQLPHGVALLFPNGLRAHFGSGSEDLLKEIFTQSLFNLHDKPDSTFRLSTVHKDYITNTKLILLFPVYISVIGKKIRKTKFIIIRWYNPVFHVYIFITFKSYFHYRSTML